MRSSSMSFITMNFSRCMPEVLVGVDFVLKHESYKMLLLIIINSVMIIEFISFFFSCWILSTFRGFWTQNVSNLQSLHLCWMNTCLMLEQVVNENIYKISSEIGPNHDKLHPLCRLSNVRHLNSHQRGPLEGLK